MTQKQLIRVHIVPFSPIAGTESRVREKAILAPTNCQDWAYHHMMIFRPKNIARFGLPLFVRTCTVCREKNHSGEVCQGGRKNKNTILAYLCLGINIGACTMGVP